MKEYTIKAQPEDAGKRLDTFIAEFAKHNDLGLSRTALQALIGAGQVTSAQNACLKPHQKVKQGDVFIIRVAEKSRGELSAENIPLDIVYEDRDVAVINKQAGLVVHPAPGNAEHTLVNALLYHCKELSDINPLRPGIVHRLDKETSGLLVIAKNNPAHLALAEQFARHSITRKYIALVKGTVAFDADVIEMPIGRHPYKRKSMAVGFGQHTRYAKTDYRTLRRGTDFSLVELVPFTGRTHQLRVHLAFLGHPVLGDTKYGKHDEFGRLALHAKTLGFIHPRTKKYMEFTSETPKEFTEFLKHNN